MADPTIGLKRTEILGILKQHGLLLQQDTSALNVVAMITGERLRGSWWSHAKGRLIFAVLSELADHPDVLLAKLLHRKVTLIHRRLWPALLAIVSKGDSWQMRDLSEPALHLLKSVNESATPILGSGPVVKELEAKLLVCSIETHTESGKHQMALEPWSAWARRSGTRSLRSVAVARKQFETATREIGATLSDLPWFNQNAAT